VLDRDLPVPLGDGWWSLVPIWEPGQTTNPLRWSFELESVHSRKCASALLPSPA
jgi:hypothetical protein